jgi:hypothetical protein
MRTHSEQYLLDWAKTHGIGVTEHYPKVVILRFQPETNEDRFWEVPPQPERRSYFALSILELMGEWQSCFVWRHSGSWPDSADPQRINDNVELQILAGLGMPLGTADVVEFARVELPQLVTLIFSTTIFGWSVGEDLYIVPNHGRFIMKTDHHAAVHVSFRNSLEAEKFVDEMNAREFPLPDDVPDETFKRPDWMGKQ